MKVALVSGVSRGLGERICKTLRSSGFRVLGVGTNPPARFGVVDDFREMDLRDVLHSRPFQKEHVDVVVNNAGVYLDDPRKGHQGVLALTMEELEETFSVNVFAAVQMAGLYVPGMLERGYGRFVSISSGMGRIGDIDGSAYAYRASKLALNALTLTLAREFEKEPADADLAAFAYCPGWIRTDMGTLDAPWRAEDSAASLASVIGRKHSAVNGRFFRREDELGWDKS